MTERLPRFHDDAVIIGKMGDASHCVYAFGPDEYYEAVLGTTSRNGDAGCTLIRRMKTSELKRAWVK